MEEKTEPEEVIVKVPLQDAIQPKDEPRKSRKFPLVCSIWFIASICNTFLVKIVLDIDGLILSTTVLMVQLLSMYTWIFTILCSAPKNNANITWLKYLKLIFPVAVSIFIRTRINDYFMWTTPISDPFSVEVEGCFSFFVLLFWKLILGNDKIDYWHMTLAAIAGWAVINLREWIFMHGRLTLPGFLGYAALTAFEMVFSKKIMQETGIHPLRLLSALSGLVLLAILPIWIWEMYRSIIYTDFVNILTPQTISIVLLFGALSSVQAATAFTILSMVPLEHYLIGSACNRITRICSFVLITTVFTTGYHWSQFEF